MGHLFEAKEWSGRHAAIRDARTRYQAGGEMPDGQELETLLQSRRVGA